MTFGARLALGLLAVANALLGNLSPKWVKRWANFLCAITWPFTGQKRKIIRTNLAIAFPELDDKSCKSLCKKNLQYIFELGLDWLHFLYHPEDINHRLVLSKEFQELRERRATDASLPPGIFCTLHLGNWELCSHMSFLTGRHGAAVAAHFNSQWINDLAARLRTDATDTVLLPAKGAVRGILHALRDNRDIGLLIDQHVSPAKGGIFLDFFNLAVAVSPLPATIALRKKLPITLVACYKAADSNFHCDVEPLPKPIDQYAEVAELTQDIFRGYEKLIRRHPEQYLWLYRYWRSCPANAPDEYARRYPFYAKRYTKFKAPETIFPSPWTP